MNNRSTDAKDTTETKVSQPQEKKPRKKKTFLDVLMKTSRFSEFRYKREFTEYIFSSFLAEAATKCLELKRKYDVLGKPIKPELAVDIMVKEGIYIETESKNFPKDVGSQFAKAENGTLIIIINPKISVKEGQHLLFQGLATCLFPEYVDFYFDGKEYKSLDDVVKNPDLLKALLTADALAAMLQSSESEAELIALQSVTQKGKKAESEKRLTVEERIIFDRRAVAVWLANNKQFHKNLSPEIEALTAEEIEKIFAEFDERIAENSDDEAVLEAADKLLTLATKPKVDTEIVNSLINIASYWKNPFDEDIVSELSGNRLASVISELLENPNLPKTFERFLCIGLNEIYNDFPKEIQGKLDEKEDFSPEYINELFKYDKENPSKREADLKEYWKEQGMEEKEVLDLSEMCGDFLRTNEATAGEKPIPLATLLSAAMKHPEMPTELYNTLSDAFCEIPEGFFDNPETIQANLEALNRKAKIKE